MALDATLAGVTSNSYVTRARAEEIALTIPGSADWLAASDDDKDLSLIQATTWLETLDYKGLRCTTTQALKWPRSGADCDGLISTCTAIPYKIEFAEVVLAIRLLANPGAIIGEDTADAPNGTFVKRQKLDALEIEYAQYNNNYNTACDDCNAPAVLQEYPWLRDLLGCYLDMVVPGAGRIIGRVRT